MTVIVQSIIQFLPYIFMLVVMGIVCDIVITAFRSGRLW